MNANELADLLEVDSWYKLVTREEIAAMLRQQQAEIEAFHNLVKEQDKKIIDLAFEKVYAERSAEVVAELYTHPVKELTDEEINQILKQHDWYSKTWVDMVRSIESAILRKAQEKCTK